MSLLNSIHTVYKNARKGVFTMKFTKKNPIVKSWVSLVLAGTYTIEEVPEIFNLREVVKSVIDTTEN